MPQLNATPAMAVLTGTRTPYRHLPARGDQAASVVGPRQEGEVQTAAPQVCHADEFSPPLSLHLRVTIRNAADTPTEDTTGRGSVVAVPESSPSATIALPSSATRNPVTSLSAVRIESDSSARVNRRGLSSVSLGEGRLPSP